MNPDARATFLQLMTDMGEGNTDWGYPDQRGLITIGRGNMIPNLAAWMRLDWRNPDNSPASSNAIQTAWALLQQQSVHVRAAGPDRWPGGGAFALVTGIRATRDSLDALCLAKIDQFDADARAEWPGWDDAPPPAQSGLMRLYWACGAGNVTRQHWPKLWAFWCGKNWLGCSTECDLPSVAKTEPKALEMERDLFREAAGWAPTSV